MNEFIQPLSFHFYNYQNLVSAEEETVDHKHLEKRCNMPKKQHKKLLFPNHDI